MLEIQKEKEESSYNEIAYLEPLTKQYDDSVYNINHTDGLLNNLEKSVQNEQPNEALLLDDTKIEIAADLVLRTIPDKPPPYVPPVPVKPDKLVPSKVKLKYWPSKPINLMLVVFTAMDFLPNAPLISSIWLTCAQTCPTGTQLSSQGNPSLTCPHI